MAYIAKGKEDIIEVRDYMGKKCVFKKVENGLDYGFIVEYMASKRMEFCDQVYKVVDVVTEDDTNYIISEFIEGRDFVDCIAFFSEEALYSIVKQVLFLIYMMNVSGLSHNDLHCGNVRVTTTDKPYVWFVYDNREYAIPTYGYMAVIIDLGAGMMQTFGEPYRICGSLWCGDSSMRLDVRYDTYRFLKSVVDCIQWKGVSIGSQLVNIVTDYIATPLNLGFFGVPTAYSYIVPILFNTHLHKMYPDAPKIDNFMTSIISSWPVKITDLENIDQTFRFIKTITRAQANEITNYVVYGTESLSARMFRPLVLIWQNYFPAMKKIVTDKITNDFNNVVIQSPINMVDWITVIEAGF